MLFRSGRDHLLEAYQVVRRTLTEATDAFEGAEARAAAELPAHAANPDVGAEVAAEVAALERGDAGDSGAGLADVDSLFARLRADSGAAEVPADGREVDAVAPDPLASVAPPADEAVAAWRARCADAIDPVRGPLLKRTKRTVQDEQNTLLDAVRRHRGRPAAAAVLPAPEVTAQAWTAALADSVAVAYGRGRVAAGGREGAPDDDVLAAVVEVVVGPLRQRIAEAIDGAEAADAGGLAERIGARYREWRGGALEEALTDGLTLAWSRGVHDATPTDGILWWVPAADGCCPDCADDALQPVRKGAAFPTGHGGPPAHPGCRCVLGPAATLSPAAST